MCNKLILPAELRVCATCSFWDGKRKIDPEMAVVVIDEACQGECLLKSACRQGLNDESVWAGDCLWEHLAPETGGECRIVETTTEPG